MDQRSNIVLLRIVACVVILASLCAVIGQLHSLPDLTGYTLLMPIALFTFGIGIGAILLGISAILQQRQKAPGEAPSADVAQSQLFDLSMKVEDLAIAVARLTHPRDAVPSPPGEVQSVQEAGTGTPDVLIELQKLFDELRDLSLLTDEQRRQRSHELRVKHKAAALQAAAVQIQRQHWADAQKTLVEIEKEWPADPAVSSVRKELELAQIQAENHALEIAESQIETEMSLSHWDQALALARKLADEFPDSVRVAKLLNRVEHEKGIYTETTVQRLFEEIRHSTERRAWRRALEPAQNLLVKFPDHPRSELMRKQIKTIQENAEIEERQEQEARIGELIRARRFREAIALSEELLRQFPTSRQAETITKLLPRIQQLAAAEESPAPQSSPL